MADYRHSLLLGMFHSCIVRLLVFSFAFAMYLYGIQYICGVGVVSLWLPTLATPRPPPPLPPYRPPATPHDVHTKEYKQIHDNAIHKLRWETVAVFSASLK